MPSVQDLNLNLLRHLGALLEEGTVSGAARALSLGQPAVSAALGRLRRHFRDPLIVRSGNVSRLTPFAETIKAPALTALRAADAVFDLGARFDPARTSREFAIVSPDWWTATLGAAAGNRLRALAPSAALRFERPGPTPGETLGAVTGAFLPHGTLRGLPHHDLVRASWTLHMASDHPLAGADPVPAGELDLYPWIVVRGGTATDGAGTDVFGTQDLHRYGLAVRAEVVLDSFLAATSFLPGTDRFLLAPRTTTADGVVTRPCPVDIPPLTLAFWWSPVHRHDPGHRWFRENVLPPIDGVEGTHRRFGLPDPGPRHPG